MYDRGKEVFKELVYNPKDWGWIGVSILLFVIFYYSFLSSITSTNPGQIYLPLYLFAIILGSLGLVTQNKKFATFTFGHIQNNEELYKSIGIGAVFGSLLVLGYAYGNGLLSIFSPPILAFGLSVTSVAITTLAVIQIFGAEIEEFSIQSAFIPTIQNFLKGGSELPIIFFFSGMMFLLFPGIQNTVISIILFAVAVVFTFNPNLTARVSNIRTLRFFSTFIIGAFVFSLFHIYAYGNAPNSLSLFESAFAFSIIDSVINWYVGNTIPGKVAHSINNGFIFSLVNSIPLQLPLLLEGVYILIIIIVNRYGNIVK